MNVGDIMTRAVRRCGLEESMDRAARLMWEGDCGVLPVVDEGGRVVGVLTDRDICMAAYTSGRPLTQIPVSVAASRKVVSVRESDSVDRAEELMREHRVRRLPVLDRDGRLAGVVSLNDLARELRGGRKHDALSADGIAKTLAAICAPRQQTALAE